MHTIPFPLEMNGKLLAWLWTCLHPCCFPSSSKWCSMRHTQLQHLIFVYFDDVLIFSWTWKNTQVIRLALQWLLENKVCEGWEMWIPWSICELQVKSRQWQSGKLPPLKSCYNGFLDLSFSIVISSVNTAEWRLQSLNSPPLSPLCGPLKSGFWETDHAFYLHPCTFSPWSLSAVWSGGGCFRFRSGGSSPSGTPRAWSYIPVPSTLGFSPWLSVTTSNCW